MTGLTEGGKSTLARAIFQSAAEPKTVVDPTDSEICDVPGAVTFRDVDELDLSLPVTRFVPEHPNDPDIWDRLFEKLFKAGGPRYVWTDEGRFPFPANATKPWPMTFQSQGRKRELGHLVCNTRPVEINRECRGQAQHVIVFPVGTAEDRQTIARDIGAELTVLERCFAELAPYGYLHFSRRARELRICPPLDLS